MGFLNDARKAVADSVYENSKQYLRQKNGYTHVIAFYIEGKLTDAAFSCDGKITSQLNQIIVGMQKDGYEILDVDIVFIPESGGIITKRQMYMASITYK